MSAEQCVPAELVSLLSGDVAIALCECLLAFGVCQPSLQRVPAELVSLLQSVMDSDAAHRDRLVVRDSHPCLVLSCIQSDDLSEISLSCPY